MEKPLAEPPCLPGRASTPIWCRGNSVRGCFSARSSPRSICRPRPSRTDCGSCRACLEFSDRGVSGTLPAGCAALHFVSSPSTKGSIPRRVRPLHGQPHLSLRRLSRRSALRGTTSRCKGVKRSSAAREPARARARRPSEKFARASTTRTFRTLSQSLDQAHRPRSLRHAMRCIAIGNSGDAALRGRSRTLARGCCARWCAARGVTALVTVDDASDVTELEKKKSKTTRQ